MPPIFSKPGGPVLTYSTLSLVFCYFIYRSQKNAAKRSSRKSSAKEEFLPSFSYEHLLEQAKYFPPPPSTSLSDLDGKKVKVAVNAEFFRQLAAIFRILLPSWRSKEFGILLLHSTFLILRTWLSVVVARVDGRIVRDLVSADLKGFLKGLALWFAIAIPATYTNSMIRYLQSKLGIAFRTRLTRYAHDLYLGSPKAYYKTVNLDGRIEDVDQYISTDLAKFCENLASLFSNLGKPILDIVIFNYQLMRNVGYLGTLGLTVNYLVTAWLIRAATPAFGKMTAQEAKLEGSFRSAHSRIITNAEEIAFYNGAELEQNILQKLYLRLCRHVNHTYKIRIFYNTFEDFVIKYCWSAAGFLVSSVPVFLPEFISSKKSVPASDGEATSSRKTGEHTQGFIVNKRLMISLADAGGRVLYSYKELAELAGRTLRVYNLLSVLHAVHSGQAAKVVNRIHGIVEKGYEGLRFENVPILVPGGGAGGENEKLIENLDFDLTPGDHLMITGGNGVGKTSLARIISGLWPIYQGTLLRPKDEDIFYVPQKQYFPIGSLRDQLIYPDTIHEMRRKGRSDDELEDILSVVKLHYLIGREGGLDTVKEWKDVLSGGEKQRVSIVRLFYHHPAFAILDECTSAVSNEIEGPMYNHAKSMGITLLTMSHRPTLFKYHKYLLTLGTGEDGHGWTWTNIGGEQERLDFEREIHQLEAKLEEIQKGKQRLQEIDKQLSTRKE